MNTQLATKNGNIALETPADYIPVAGIDKLTPDDFSIPVAKLVQTNTKIDGADALAGQWYRTDTGETSETIKALIIGIQKSRILFATEYDGTGKALCRSDDAIAPRPEFNGAMVYYQPGSATRKAVVSEAESKNDFVLPLTCADCPLSQWSETGDKPPCRLSDNWAALTDESDPILIRFGGSAAKISAKLRNLARAATAKRRPLYVQLSSHFEEGEIGAYYVPDLTLLKEPLPSDLLETAKAFVGLNLAARAAEMFTDDEATESGAHVEAAPQQTQSNGDSGPEWSPDTTSDDIPW